MADQRAAKRTAGATRRSLPGPAVSAGQSLGPGDAAVTTAAMNAKPPTDRTGRRFRFPKWSPPEVRRGLRQPLCLLKRPALPAQRCARRELDSDITSVAPTAPGHHDAGRYPLVGLAADNPRLCRHPAPTLSHSTHDLPSRQPPTDFRRRPLSTPERRCSLCNILLVLGFPAFRGRFFSRLRTLPLRTAQSGRHRMRCSTLRRPGCGWRCIRCSRN